MAEYCNKAIFLSPILFHPSSSILCSTIHTQTKNNLECQMPKNL
jgi:hypothetical protein